MSNSIKSFKGLSNTSLNSVYSKEFLMQFFSTFRESIESSFDKILDLKIKKAYRFEEITRTLIFENFIEIISSLCIPKPPTSFIEVDFRLKNYSRILDVMKPTDDQLDNMRAVATKGKRSKLCVPYEKLVNGFKGVYGQLDSNVLLYVFAITECIIQNYLEVGIDYQMRAKQVDDHVLYQSTMQIIFLKYNRTEEQLMAPMYSYIHKLTKQFATNYSENIKNFILFLRDSRDQLDVLIKVFQQTFDKDENVQNVFGNIGDVIDSLGLVLDTLDDSTEGNRRSMAMDLMDLAEMEMFTPFKIYAKEVIYDNASRDKIEGLLKPEGAVARLVSHYNSILGIVFSKCTEKRCNDLMIRYRLFHVCEFCCHPHDAARHTKTSWSTIDSRSEDTTSYDLFINQLNIYQDRISSSSSSITSNSESPRVTRGPSPMDLDLVSEDRSRIYKSSIGSIKCNLLVNCYKYLLPRLLLFPMFQFLFIYHILDSMCKCKTEDTDQREELANLTIVVQMLRSIIFTFEDILSQNNNLHTEFTRLQFYFVIGSVGQESAKDVNAKLADIKNMVKKKPDNWEWPSSNNSEFIMEGPVQLRVSNKKTLADRYLYLFSNMLLVCKKQLKKAGLVGNQVTDLKLKQRIVLEQFHILDAVDRSGDDNEDLFAFTLEYLDRKEGKVTSSTGSSPSPSQKGSSIQISGRVDTRSLIVGSTSTLASLQTITDHESISHVNVLQQQVHNCERFFHSIAIYLTNIEDKTDWIASLLQIQTKRFFSQYVTIKNIEEMPLKLPDPSIYRFAEPDSPFNIEYEMSQNENSGDIPIIKMATLEKLITHLTSHAYCDGKTLNIFLLIFRNFTTPEALLDLLIERFDIPDPVFTESERRPLHHSENSYADRILKKFRTAYKRKMQLRVVNLVTKWINNVHYFKMDFSSNLALLDKLQSFLDRNMVSSHLSLKIKTVKKNIADRLTDSGSMKKKAVCDLSKQPPMIEIPLCASFDKVSVLTVHPLELARQITLFEWRLYSKIEFWEVNGREKQDGPNFTASIEFSNKILYWLIYEIMRHRNMHDRVTAILRVADLMEIFEDIHNLQGAQECKGALISASVYRLKDTFDYIASKYKNSYRILFEKLRNDYQESSESYMAQYQTKIHKICPPVLPYIAMGDKTQLIHMNLKNPNYFVRLDPSTSTEVQLINFWKFRQMSELIQHYLSFQDTPYNFQEQPIIQTFLSQLDIFREVKATNHYEFDDFAHSQSLYIQPKVGEAPTFPDRQMTAEEMKLANSLNILSLREKLDAGSKSVTAESPPPLPPKIMNHDPRMLPPLVPDRPGSNRRDSDNLSPPSSCSSIITLNSPSLNTHIFSSADTLITSSSATIPNATRPPIVPSRSQSRETQSLPPTIPPRLPPLPPKNSDSI